MNKYLISLDLERLIKKMCCMWKRNILGWFTNCLSLHILLSFSIQLSIGHGRACTFVFAIWAAHHKSTISSLSWIRPPNRTSWPIWKSSPNTSSSLHHSTRRSKASRAIQKWHKRLRMVKKHLANYFWSFFRVCSRMDSGFNSFSFCSSSHVIVPSSPPDNVQTGMLNLTAGWVRWSPPPPQHHNGHLLGYKIQVSAVLAVVVKIAVCFDRIKSISHE